MRGALLVSVVLLFASLPAQAKEKLFVFHLKGEGVDPKVLALSERSLVAAASDAGYDAIGVEDVGTLANLEVERQLAGCDGGNSCMAEIAGGVGARLVLSGAVTAIDDGNIVNLSLFDTEAGAVIARASSKVIPTRDVPAVSKTTFLRLLNGDAAWPAALLWTGGIAAGVGAAVALAGGVTFLTAVVAANEVTAGDANNDAARVGRGRYFYDGASAVWNNGLGVATAVGGGLVLVGGVLMTVGWVGTE
jgi:hypothetical protein